MVYGCKWWIFDMDGTLTVPVHDFAAIRAHLRIAPNASILEALDQMSPDRAAWAHNELDIWERRLAKGAVAQPDAVALLQALSRQGAVMGVLTRNTVEHARTTLQTSGLAGYFDEADVLGRDSATPKPDPAGVQLLTTRWGADPAQTVMVGDFVHDAHAGRAAGVRTALVMRRTGVDWTEQADVVVDSLLTLLEA